MKMMRRRVPLLGAYNIRDLGGYPTADGGVTKFGVFLRADVLSEFGPSEAALAAEYDLRLVVDLRDEMEIEKVSNAFERIPGCRVEHVPLMKELMVGSSGDGSLMSKFPPIGSLGEMYVAILEKSQNELRRTMQLMAAEQTGACAYNCSAGKDRTGVVSAILLLLAGVERIDVVADYVTTGVYIGEKIKKMGMEHSVYTEAAAPNIEMFLDALEKHGGAVKYLLEIGLSQGEIDAMRDRFVTYGK